MVLSKTDCTVSPSLNQMNKRNRINMEDIGNLNDQDFWSPMDREDNHQLLLDFYMFLVNRIERKLKTRMDPISSTDR